MPEQLVQQESMRFTPSTLVSLYTLNGTNIGMQEVFYFCDGTNSSFQSIVFNGVTYAPFPIISTKFGYDGTGKPVRPTLTVSNLRGLISQLLLQNQNLVGAMLIRQRVFARFLDNANFPNNINPFGTPDPSAAYTPEIWYVNRKTQESQQLVEWELASLFETDGVKLPRRQILANVCNFRYRDPSSCSYNGAPLADLNSKLFVGGGGTYGFSSLNNRGTWSPSTGYNAGDYVVIYSYIPQFAGLPLYYVCLGSAVTGNANSPINNPSLWVQDACPKTIKACKMRFAPPLALRGGFFPGVAQAPYVVGRNS